MTESSRSQRAKSHGRISTKRKLIALAAVATLSACSQEVVSSPEESPEPSPEPSVSELAAAMELGEADVQRIEEYLERRTPPDVVVATRELHGEPVDCIDYYEQPAARALRARGIEVEAPQTKPQYIKDDSPVYSDGDGRGPVLDVPCPDGSVPVRRLSVDEIASFGGLDAYLHKAPPAVNDHEYATVALEDDSWGAEAVINVWSPAGVTSTGDFSLSQIWVTGGAGSTLETVEGGWIKRPGQSSRLFIYFTPDNYGSGSCWNDDCGFVQTDTSVVLDGTFSNYSSSGGTQYAWKWHLRKDTDAGDWWFGWNGTWVGYWPRTLFSTSGIRNHGDWMGWGGEIYDLTGASHTTADMGGDGSFAGDGFGEAAYQRTIRFNPDNAGTWAEANPAPYVIDDEDCYDLDDLFSSGTWKNHFFFGGPGYHATNCPL